VNTRPAEDGADVVYDDRSVVQLSRKILQNRDVINSERNKASIIVMDPYNGEIKPWLIPHVQPNNFTIFAICLFCAIIQS